MKTLEKKKFLPFLLSLGIVIFDQLTKYLVVKYIPENTIAKKYFGDFLWICHVRNTGAAFSLGAGGSNFMRIVVLIILPLALMVFVAWLVVSKKNFFSPAQRWFAAGILGGGIGTIIDRISRFDSGVVDFISVKFYGIFGLERWPTFNVSDSCVVIFVILLAISMVFGKAEGEAKK
jgi:signal peptidase II